MAIKNEFETSVDSLRNTDEYKKILEHLTIIRENLLVEFKNPQVIENNNALAFLAGRIEQTDNLIIELGGPVYPRDQFQ